MHQAVIDGGQDFEPIVEQLIKVRGARRTLDTPPCEMVKTDQASQEGHKEPYNWDAYAQVFFPKAEELVAEAEKAETEGHREKASEFYMFEQVRSSPGGFC